MQVENFSNEFLLRCSKIFAENLKLLFESDVTVQHLEIQDIETGRFGESFPLPVVVSNIQAEHEYKGNGFLISSKRDAILIGCLLVEIGDAAMQEKITSLSFTDDEFDAYKEICNQIIGLLDQVFVEMLPKKIHLKQMNHVKAEDEKDVEKIVEIMKDEDYLINYPFQLSFDKKYHVNLNFVLPKSFIFQFSEKEFKNISESTDTEINSFDDLEVLFIQVDKTNDSSIKDVFSDNNISCKPVNTLSQLLELVQQNPKKLVVIEAARQIEKGIEICGKISKIFANQPVQIWLQGDHWNSFSVYKATLAGANYVLVSPVSKSVVKQRLLQLNAQKKIAA